ncbi:hypothetical protein E8F11_07720 [Pseudomonas sp. BN417]|nr:hypothetical protein [Pseudomonas sp. BN417]
MGAEISQFDADDTRQHVRARSKDRELETCKAKTGEEAEFTTVNEHSEPVFNAAGPTRSSL